MNIVSYFAGAGGMDLGFSFAGHNIIWANDFDQAAVNTYNNNIGKFSNHNAECCDIVKLLDKSKEEIDKIIPDCDVIIGGFPCQGFTIANLNRSMSDDRNFLYMQLLKGISVKQPPFFLLENVKGLENIDDGQVLPMIIKDLENAGTKDSKLFPSDGPGYRVVYNVLNAYDFGVPQNRERVIILGIRNDIELGSLKDHILEKPLNKDKPSKKLYLAPTHSSKSKAKEEDLPKDKTNKMYDDWVKSINVKDYFKPDGTLYATTTLRDAIGDIPWEYDDNTTFHNHCGSKCKVKIANHIGNRATKWDHRGPTIMGRGSGTGGPLIPPHPEQHRRLSIREVARIQTFPDNFIFCGTNSECYRQIGNAVPVLLAYNVALMLTEREECGLPY